jgi:purine-binding chemotaxis protein CheW
MNQEKTMLDKRASELRLAFDRSFAQAPAGDSVPTEAFLAIGAGGDDYALRLTDISGLHADKKVTPLPSDVSELLGLASFRGALVPVYDLRMLLGYAAGPPPRWMVLVAPQTPIGLAFDCFDGHLRPSRDDLAHEEKIQEGRQHLAESLRTDGRVRPIVNVASIIESINKRTQPGFTDKER